MVALLLVFVLAAIRWSWRATAPDVLEPASRPLHPPLAATTHALERLLAFGRMLSEVGLIEAGSEVRGHAAARSSELSSSRHVGSVLTRCLRGRVRGREGVAELSARIVRRVDAVAELVRELLSEAVELARARIS